MRRLAMGSAMSAFLLLCNGCNSKSAGPVEPSDSIAWTRVTSASASLSVNAFCSSGPNILAGTDAAGVLLSVDDGASWLPANNGIPSNTPVTSFAVSGTNVYLGTEGQGAYFSSDGGMNWTAVNNGLANTFVMSLAANGTNVFAGTFGGLYGTVGGGVYLTTDNGASWKAVNNGLTETLVSALVVSPTSIFAGTRSGIYLSTDTGSTWTAANSGLTYDWGIGAFAVNCTNLYACPVAYGIFLSTNNGTTWNAVNSPSKYVKSIAIGGTTLYAATGNGVFASTDQGENWNQFSTGLGDSLVSVLAVFGSHLFAGNYPGTYPVSYRGPIPVGGIWRRSI